MARQDRGPANAAAIRKQALATLAELGGQTTGEDDVVFEGRKFILPATMKNLDEAVKFLTERRNAEEEEYEFHRKFDYRPFDGAAAVGRALKKAFGMAVGKTVEIPGLFGPTIVKPSFISIPTGPDTQEQVPWGYMGIPGLDGVQLELDSTHDTELGRVFVIHGEGPRKYRKHVEGFFDLVEQELRTGSIYKGKAIDGRSDPHFLDVSSTDPESVVYREDVLAQLEANVWSPVEDTDVLSDLGQPGKRAVLFEGTYGTGKTLAAYLTAQRAVEHGWTFLMARPGRDNLEEVLQTARMYQPAVVFTEDIDTLADPATGDRDHMSKVLDLFDGLDTKGLKMLLVLTTNNVDKLHPGILRPGRLDAVISIGDLDLAGVRKLAEYVLGDKLAHDVDWEKVYEANEGYTPAYVKEGLDRVVRYSVRRNGRLVDVTTEDLVYAAEGLRPQHELMRQADARANTKPDALREGLGQLVGSSVEETLDRAQLVRSDGAPQGLRMSVGADKVRKHRELKR